MKFDGIICSLKKKGFEGLLEKSVLGITELRKRWHGILPTEEQLLPNGKVLEPGDVIDKRPKGMSYDKRIRSNYVNCPYRTEIMYLGTTHVAIGFNDLNSLINSVWQPATSLDQSKEAAYWDVPKGAT